MNALAQKKEWNWLDFTYILFSITHAFHHGEYDLESLNQTIWFERNKHRILNDLKPSS